MIAILIGVGILAVTLAVGAYIWFDMQATDEAMEELRRRRQG